MRDFAVLSAALEIVEQRLCEPMNASDLADACYFSYSGLQKLFNYAFGCSVSEYITKRRLSRASNKLLSSDESITGIAFDYQYSSSEAFTRAFRRFWGITPSEFRKTRRFSELQPKFIIEQYGGFTMANRKPLDVSELYDTLKTLGGTFALGIDIIHFAEINNRYGYSAGDIVIAEAFARIERELTETMLLFRTGGDEFAVVTAYENAKDADALARSIAVLNGEAVNAGGHKIPLSFHIGISRVPEDTLDYQTALEILHKSVKMARQAPDHVAHLAKSE